MRGPRNILNNTPGGGSGQQQAPPSPPPPQQQSAPVKRNNAAPNPPSTNNQQPQPQPKKQKPQKPPKVTQVKGIVRSVNVTTEKKMGIVRMFEALGGHTYSRDATLNAIQIDYLNSSQSCQVLVYGTLTRGVIVSGNVITVDGKFDSMNRFVASAIFNENTSSVVPILRTISPVTIGATIIAVVLILSFLVLSGVFINIVNWAIAAVIVIIVLIAGFKFLKFYLANRFSRKR